MRRFSDGAGRIWEVVAGRESWGSFFAIFVPRAGAGEDGKESPGIRQTALRATGYKEANEVLNAFSDAELRELLGRSSPKDTA